MKLSKLLLILSLLGSSVGLAACQGGGTGVYRGGASVHVGYGRAPWHPWYPPPIVVPPDVIDPPEPELPIAPEPPIAVPYPEPDFGGGFGGGDFGGDFGDF